MPLQSVCDSDISSTRRPDLSVDLTVSVTKFSLLCITTEPAPWLIATPQRRSARRSQEARPARLRVPISVALCACCERPPHSSAVEIVTSAHTSMQHTDVSETVILARRLREMSRSMWRSFWRTGTRRPDLSADLTVPSEP